MSYDLYVWKAAEPLTPDAARAACDQLLETDEYAGDVDADLSNFFDRLCAIYPPLESLSDDRIDESPWSVSPELSRNILGLSLTYSSVEAAFLTLTDLAGKHGLVCYDPQKETVELPPALAGVPRLWLTLEDGTVIDRPSDRQIEEAVRNVVAASDEFAILERSSQTYIQTASNGGLFCVEYQDGSTDRHFQATTRNMNDVIVALQSYARNDGRWQGMFTWQRITF